MRYASAPPLSSTRLNAALHLLAGVVIAMATLFAAGRANAADTPGALISATPMPNAPDGATAYRVVYNSTGIHGETVPVSGVVIIPRGPAPPSGRPIVAWAHPTTGVETQCAPSRASVFFSSVQGLGELLGRGYVVVATDYPGLGTPEVHPYLVGTSEGRAVLDSVRVARQLTGAEAGSAFAVWGHSQGGHAALFAGLLAQAYAPELHLVGIAVAAPATNLAQLMQDDQGSGSGNNITAMTLWSWSRVYDAPITQVVTPEALPTINNLASKCIERWFDLLSRSGPTKALQKSFLSVDDLATLEPWQSLLAENTPAPLPPEIPVFIAQGTSDTVVRPSVTSAYADALCKQGSKVLLDWLQGTGHAFVARDAANSAAAWIAERFAGGPAPSNCRQ